jgi:hypothetical protein
MTATCGNIEKLVVSLHIPHYPIKFILRMKDSATQARTYEVGAEDVDRGGKPILYVIFVVCPDGLSSQSLERRISEGTQV